MLLEFNASIHYHEINLTQGDFMNAISEIKKFCVITVVFSLTIFTIVTIQNFDLITERNSAEEVKTFLVSAKTVSQTHKSTI